MRAFWRTAGPAGLLLFVHNDAFAQCAMCRTMLTGSLEGRALSGPLDHAILLLFVAPYLVLGTLAAVAFRRPLARYLRAQAARLSGRIASSLRAHAWGPRHHPAP